MGMIQIPQRFQTVHGLSPFQASLRLLPFGFLVAFGCMVGAGVCKKAKIPILYIIMLGSVLQIVGFSLLSTTPHSQEIFMGQYGYQVIAGLGTGMTVGCLLVIMPFTVEERDKCKSSRPAPFPFLTNNNHSYCRQLSHPVPNTRWHCVSRYRFQCVPQFYPREIREATL